MYPVGTFSQLPVLPGPARNTASRQVSAGEAAQSPAAPSESGGVREVVRVPRQAVRDLSALAGSPRTRQALASYEAIQNTPADDRDSGPLSPGIDLFA